MEIDRGVGQQIPKHIQTAFQIAAKLQTFTEQEQYEMVTLILKRLEIEIKKKDNDESVQD